MMERWVELGAKEGDLIIIGFVQLEMLTQNRKSADKVEDWQKLYLGSISVF
jgi:hypothetical protein